MIALLSVIFYARTAVNKQIFAINSKIILFNSNKFLFNTQIHTKTVFDTDCDSDIDTD